MSARTGGATLIAALVPAFFGGMLLYIVTLRVELDGDQISFEHFFRRFSLRLDQIRSVRGTVRATSKGPLTYLVIEPIHRYASQKIRMDFFSHAEVQTIRIFLLRQAEALREEEP